MGKGDQRCQFHPPDLSSGYTHTHTHTAHTQHTHMYMAQTRHTHTQHTYTWCTHTYHMAHIHGTLVYGTHIHDTHMHGTYVHDTHSWHTCHTYTVHTYTAHTHTWHTHTAHTLDSQATDGAGAAFSHPPRPTHKQTHTINSRLPAPNLGMCSRSLTIPPSTEHRTPCLWKPVGLFDQPPCSLYTRCSSEAGSTLYASFLLLWDLMLQSECFKITH